MVWGNEPSKAEHGDLVGGDAKRGREVKESEINAEWKEGAVKVESSLERGKIKSGETNYAVGIITEIEQPSM